MNIREVIRQRSNAVIGMVHCLPLPGTWHFNNECSHIVERAVQDAMTLEKAGVNAIMIENMCDDPLSITLETEQVAALSAITAQVRKAVSLPIGIDAAFNDYKASLSIAKFNDCQFIRIPVFVDMVQYFGGIIYPCAREALLYRKKLQAEEILILADVQVKHTNLVVPVPIEQSAKNACANGADAIIVTGSTTGEATPLEMIQRAKKVVSIPVLAGSGVNKETVKEQFAIADGAIIGSSFKEKGILSNPIVSEKVRELMEQIEN